MTGEEGVVRRGSPVRQACDVLVRCGTAEGKLRRNQVTSRYIVVLILSLKVMSPSARFGC